MGHAVVAIGDHEPILPADDFQAGDEELIAVAQVDGGAEPEPFILLVVVIAHPVGQVLLPRRAGHALAPVVGEVAAGDRELLRVAGQEGDHVPAGREVLDGDVVSLHLHGQASELVRLGRVVVAHEGDAGEIDRDPIPPDRDGGLLDRGRIEAVLARGEGGVFGDHHALRQLGLGEGGGGESQEGQQEGDSEGGHIHTRIFAGRAAVSTRRSG